MATYPEPDEIIVQGARRFASGYVDYLPEITAAIFALNVEIGGRGYASKRAFENIKQNLAVQYDARHGVYGSYAAIDLLDGVRQGALVASGWALGAAAIDSRLAGIEAAYSNGSIDAKVYQSGRSAIDENRRLNAQWDSIASDAVNQVAYEFGQAWYMGASMTGFGGAVDLGWRALDGDLHRTDVLAALPLLGAVSRAGRIGRLAAADTRLAGGTFDVVGDSSRLTLSSPRLAGFENVEGKIVSGRSVHPNSLDYVGDTHVYAIRGPDGSLYKIGESTQGVRVGDGASIRAERQARQLFKETGDVYRTEVRGNFGNKADARAYETRFIQTYTRLYGRPPGNPLDR